MNYSFQFILHKGPNLIILHCYRKPPFLCYWIPRVPPYNSLSSDNVSIFRVFWKNLNEFIIM